MFWCSMFAQGFSHVSPNLNVPLDPDQDLQEADVLTYNYVKKFESVSEKRIFFSGGPRDSGTVPLPRVCWRRRQLSSPHTD